MKGVKLLKINAVLFLLAIAIGFYMVWHHYAAITGETGFRSFCSINQTFDCDAVNASQYAEVFGMPVATLALAYYLFAFLGCIGAARNAYRRRELILLLLPASLVSGALSLVMVGIQVFLLKTFCLFCLSLGVLDLITMCITLAIVRDFTRATSLRHEISQLHSKALASYFVVGLALLIGTHVGTLQLKHEIPFDEEQFINDFRAQPAVSIPVDKSPFLGHEGGNPPVQLVEFFDYQCPHCALAAKLMHRLTRVYQDKIQLVMKNFAFDAACNPSMQRMMHPYACIAARSAYCAGKQGKFHELHEKLFENQESLSEESIKSLANELKLDAKAFDACVASEESIEAVRKDGALAGTLGVNSTPTFFVNGRKVEGIIDEQRLKALLRDLGVH